MIFNEYDIIVVGGGHAGCEAAIAGSNLSCRVLLITMKLNTIGQMSCNPAMGGIAKGQIVREIDALGGCSGIVSDLSMIQFRLLNQSKGPAMWSPRSQNDRALFAKIWREKLESRSNIDLWQDHVVDLIIEEDTVKGVKTGLGLSIYAKTVVLTNGTFLGGTVHIGKNNFSAGRIGDSPSLGLTQTLKNIGFEAGRLKTGTPPRIDGRSLNYSKMQEQEGEHYSHGFSFKNIPTPVKQRNCHITYTNPEVHKILKEGFADSPMFCGTISGVGPRYCPSVEDKIVRFADKERHQIFVEPEGWNTVEVYVNGFSTSLPLEIQHKAIRKIEGFENAKILQPGYAIEYDYFVATQLQKTMETRLVQNLYFAGQINGTTGYEEAAAQGLAAGLNAALRVLAKKEYVFSRTNSYIGVLIDDITSKPTTEPYRMFTSRAEFRLLLRNDNADIRLTPIGYDLGLVSEADYIRVKNKIETTKKIVDYLKATTISPKEFSELKESLNTNDIRERSSFYQILQRPEIELNQLISNSLAIQEIFHEIALEIVEQVEIVIKYESYIEREKEMAEKVLRIEKHSIPQNIDYDKIIALSAEAREKLKKFKPKTIGDAVSISGITPADIAVLTVFIGR